MHSADTDRKVLFWEKLSITPLPRVGEMRDPEHLIEWQEYEGELTLKLRKLWGISRPPVEELPLKISAAFWVPRQRLDVESHPIHGADVSQYTSPLLKAAIGVVYQSHSQISELNVYKNWAVVGTAITLRVELLDPPSNKRDTVFR